MGGIFVKKKQTPRITAQDRAILQLKQQRDKLKQYQKRVEFSLQSDRLLAKKLLDKGQRERAKLLLRKKRFQENQLQKTDRHLETIEVLTNDLEFVQIETQVVDGLQKGNQALKQINDTFCIEEIEKILEESAEGAEKQQEISKMLSGVLTQDDEEAVEDELQSIIEETFPNIPDQRPDSITSNDQRTKQPQHKTRVLVTEE